MSEATADNVVFPEPTQKDVDFWDFMYAAREIISESNRTAAAFLIGLKKGPYQKLLNKVIALDPEDPSAEIAAFEFAVMVKPALLEISAQILPILIKLAVQTILVALGVSIPDPV